MTSSPTPDDVVEAAVAACREPRNHRYTPAGGPPVVRTLGATRLPEVLP